MSYRYFIFLVCVALVSETVFLGQSRQFETYEISLKDNQTDMADVINKVEIVGLEETNETLLSFFEFYLPIPDGFILGSKGDKRFYFFDQEGNFRFHIESKEKGVNWFSGFSSAWIKNNRLEFFASSQSKFKLFRYDLKGNLIESINLPLDKGIRLGGMRPFNGGYVVNTVENISIEGGVEKSAEGHAIVYLADDLSIIQYGHKDNTVPPFPIAIVPRLQVDGTKTLYKEVLNDSIFLITEDDVELFMKFDYGSEWAWNDPMHSENLGIAFSVVERSPYVNDFKTFFNKKYIYVSSIINTMRKHSLISRGNKNYINIRGDMKEMGFVPISVDDGQLVAFLQTYSLEAFLKDVDAEKIEIRGNKSMSQLLNSENPVLLFLDFTLDE